MMWVYQSFSNRSLNDVSVLSLHLAAIQCWTNPLDKLSEITTTSDMTVYDLVYALQPTEEEVQLI